MSELFKNGAFNILLVVTAFTAIAGCSISSLSDLRKEVSRVHEEKYPGSVIREYQLKRNPTPQGAIGISVTVKVDSSVGEKYWWCTKSAEDWSCKPKSVSR